MSRARDRRRHETMTRLDPDYKGFRGFGSEPSRRGKTPLEPATCTVCGRTRNVPRGVALEQGDGYVCSRCTEAAAAPQVPEAEPES